MNKKKEKTTKVKKKIVKKKTTKRRSRPRPIEIPENTPSIEIIINEDGLVGGVRSTHSFAFRIIDESIVDERTNEAFAVAWGYTKQGGELVIPQYDPEYLKIYGVD